MAVTSKKTLLLAGLSEILEQEATPETDLLASDLWDSMTVVMTVALLDDLEVTVDGQKLSECATVADIIKLAGIES